MLIRTATRNDGGALGRLGALLMDAHYNFDPRRFLDPGGNAAPAYAQFLIEQLDDPDSIIMVAVIDDSVVGYCYGAIEPLSWKELRDTAGFIHDLALEPHARRRGAAAALLNEVINWFHRRRVARVMLWTSTKNAPARRLFERAGFRPTMTEMTLELDAPIKIGK